MKIRPIAWIVAPDNEPIYGERTTKISIGDEAAGEFVVIAQGDQELRFDLEEWYSIENAVKVAIAQITIHREGESIPDSQEDQSL